MFLEKSSVYMKLTFHTAQCNTLDIVFLKKRIDEQYWYNTDYCNCHYNRIRWHCCKQFTGHISKNRTVDNEYPTKDD